MLVRRYAEVEVTMVKSIKVSCLSMRSGIKRGHPQLVLVLFNA